MFDWPILIPKLLVCHLCDFHTDFPKAFQAHALLHFPAPAPLPRELWLASRNAGDTRSKGRIIATRTRRKEAPKAPQECDRPVRGREGGHKLKEVKGSQRKLMKVMIKQMLKLSQVMRDMEGTVFDTVIIKGNSAEAIGMQQQTKAYGDGVKAAGKAYQLGPPHIYAWGGLVAALVRKGPAIGQKNLDTLTVHLTSLEEANIEEKCEMVRFCRINKMYKEDLRRIAIAIQPSAGQLRTVLLAALGQAGGERKMGKGPPTNMERELQNWIEGMDEADE